MRVHDAIAISITTLLIAHLNQIAAAPFCSTEGMKWASVDGNILLNNKVFHLKGANWFGFETPLSILHGLWETGTTLSAGLDFLQDIKVNALRVPLSLELMLNLDAVIEQHACVECKGATAVDMLEQLFNESAQRGMVVLLDCHRMQKGVSSALWYDGTYTEKQFIQGWVNLLKHFINKPNLMGIDLKNEPHETATWGMNDPKTDWNSAAERIVADIVKAFPGFDKLIFVEGIGSDDKTQLTAPAPTYSAKDQAGVYFYGANLIGVYTDPIDFGSARLNDLIVYSPHQYGPSLYPHAYFDAPDLSAKMTDVWNKQIGYIEGLTGKATVIGEWGGLNVGKDKELQALFVKYMSHNCLGDAFIWALNPNSRDIGGILEDDWKTPDAGKIALMDIMQPFPSVFTTPITAKHVCIEYGAFPIGSVCDIADNAANLLPGTFAPTMAPTSAPTSQNT